MELPFFHVDAFTAEPGKGNAAGVYLLPDAPAAGQVERPAEIPFLSLAASRGLPETGFVQARNGAFALRWFTEKTELNLCGHGTLAAAHVLWEQGLAEPGQPIHFDTCSGRLTVRQTDDNWIELDFPAFSRIPAELPAAFADSFDRPPLETFFAHDRYLVVLESEEAVRNYHPDFRKLADHRVLITARAREGANYDFVSRFFAVPYGVDEDPVTGSAHCALGPYWASVLGKNAFLAYQASARGGFLKVRCEGDRVLIAGQAVTVHQSAKS